MEIFLTPEVVTMSSAVVQAIATAVLVGVTIFYAVQTKKTVETMDRNSKAEFLPVLMLAIYPATSNEKTLQISLTNIGKGMAIKPIEVRFPGVGPLRLNSLPVNEEAKATIRYDIAHILDIDADQRKIRISYNDIFGRQISTEAVLVEVNNLGLNGNGRGISWESWTPIIP